MSKRDCVEHLKSGRDAWMLGFSGYVTDTKSQLFTILLTIVTMSTPWWWWTPSPVFVDPRDVLIAASLALGASIYLGGSYLRYRANRSLEIKRHLHQLAHFVRDSYADSVQPRTAEQGADDDRFRFYKYSEGLSDKLREYFCTLSNDRSVGIAIRLAVPVEGTNEVAYRTIARAGLNANRKDTSEDIHQSQGTPGFFLKKDRVGVLIYSDLPAAVRLEAFKKTKSEEKYSEDVASMIVAPLNAWDSCAMKMIGLLCITSPRRNAFGARDVDAALFAADTVSNSIASVVHNLKALQRMPVFRTAQNAQD